MPDNLDQRAMRAAGEILAACEAMDRDAVENLATKGVGVVLEQGIYAGLLFYYSKVEYDSAGEPKSPSIYFVQHLLGLCKVVPQGPPQDFKKPLTNLEYLATSVCGNLHQIILVKTLWEQTLTYVRYGAKALKKADSSAKEPKEAHVAR